MDAKKVAVGLAVTSLAGAGLYHAWNSHRHKKMTKEMVNKLMAIFESPHVYIRNPAIVREKIQKLIDNGADKLQVISDFDRTITKCFAYGKPGDTSHGAIEKATCMSEDFRQKAKEAKEKYYPLENSIDISYEERTALMVEWWETNHGLILENGFQKRWLPGVVSEANIILRGGTDEFFHILNEFGIPLYIVSAGIGDVIEEAIHKESTLYNNSRIIANFMDFDKEGNLLGFKGELIHSYNKQEVVDHTRACFDRSIGRSNMILLGDTLGDPKMADNMNDVTNILKIGFLNNQVDELLDTFQQAFDIVLVEDETMDVINVFLKELMKNK